MTEGVRPGTAWSDKQVAAIRRQLDRLLAGASLRQSPQQQRLLRYVVDATLAGDAPRLKGYTLGAEALGRGAGFDPNIDPIVRIEVARLRNKLLAHYSGEGTNDPVLIDVPKGSYAARFVFVAAGPGDDAYTAASAALPLAPGPLFGRGPELQALRALMAQHRLVTVLGAGGIGKTSFALAAAHAHVAVDRGCAAWVELAGLTDPAWLAATLARALGLTVSQSDDPLPALLSALRPITAWVVLDNAEHLVDAVARLAQAVLGAAPGLRLLVTSQAALHLDGERLFRLASLDVPATDDALASAAQASAVALFVDRARALDHRFELTQQNLGAVVRLCRRLDGLPLAIRLAAGRVHLLGLSGLESHLDDRLQWLASESRDAPTRQQTLLAALDWSYGLLSASEQQLFRRLGVFVGGFTLELAVAVGSGADTDRWAVTAELDGLVERSLVSIDPGEPPRYRLLESQREHALRELTRRGELHAAQQQHARALERELLRADQDLWTSMPDARWLALWAPELDNTRAAMAWSAQHDRALFVSLAACAHRLFRLLDQGHELRWRTAAVDVDAIEGLDAGAATRYWLARSYLESGVSGAGVHDFAARAEHIARAGGDRLNLYKALSQRAASSLVVGDEAETMLAEIVALESADWPPRLHCQRWLAEFVVHNLHARWPQALHAAETGYSLAIEGGSTGLTAVFGNWTVVARLGAGDVDGALQCSRAIRHRIVPGPAITAIPFLGTCSRILLKQGELAATRRQLATMFDLSRSIAWANFEVFGDLYLGLALAEHRLGAAARLLGYASAATARAWGVPRSTRTRDDARALLASAIGPERMVRLCAEGATLDPESVCRWVLAEQSD